ncbi:MAG: Unknown protein [uncultured Thiotrichaceae bacterium]|uniref:Acyltransferase 3 domain-containing protein n=1 Tax=uncultured Thiotrichaceae bacterium TaxID=298394 RepID=A0A6S6TK20_9GAMM|nr:MAG: Unknown protein [uncultured Thiotrichaceae bacterium]
MKVTRLLELDALRGLAALAVVFYHYFYRYDTLYQHDDNIAVKWAQFGHFGVELFFMVSGFVIFWTLHRVKAPLDFIVSRFSRLYPTYWVSLAFTYMIISVFGLSGREVPLTEALGNMLMFHQYLGIEHVDGVYWTLTVELTFYFWVFCLFLMNSLSKVEYVFITMVGFSVLDGLGYLNIPKPVYAAFILKYISFFLAGICFYKITHDMKANKTWVILGMSLLSTIAVYSYGEFLLFCFFYIIFYLASSGNLRFLTYKPLVLLGSISYPLYLIHQNLGYVVINAFYQFKWHPLAGILLALVLSVIVAYVLARFVEKPAVASIRQFYRDWKTIR